MTDYATIETLTTVTVDLPGNRVFAARLFRGEDGKPGDLILSASFASDGHGWRTHAGSFCVPGSALAEIRQALERLEGRA